MKQGWSTWHGPRGVRKGEKSVQDKNSVDRSSLFHCLGRFGQYSEQCSKESMACGLSQKRTWFSKAKEGQDNDSVEWSFSFHCLRFRSNFFCCIALSKSVVLSILQQVQLPSSLL